jgi:hypothetical protein
MLGAGALLTATALPITRALADQRPSLMDPMAVYPPPGYSFDETPRLIRGEWDSLADFYQAYFDGMTGSPGSDAYGLALANQFIGL